MLAEPPLAVEAFFDSHVIPNVGGNWNCSKCVLALMCRSCCVNPKNGSERDLCVWISHSFNTRPSCVARENAARSTRNMAKRRVPGAGSFPFPHYRPVIIILTTDTSSASEDEGSLRRQGRISSTPFQSHSNVEPWLNRVIQGSSTSSSASSTSSHPGGKPAAASNTAPATTAATVLADLMAHSQIGQ